MPALTNIGYLAGCKAEGGQDDIHCVRDAALVWRDDKIMWVGAEANLPENYVNEKKFDAGGKMVIPGLVDCHTHLAFGGWRAGEFALRIQRKSYLEIGRSGGGIMSTVEATRSATEEELYEKAVGLLNKITKLGITSIECKSGYGLSVEDELKVLRIYNKLAKEQPAHIIPTFLGAHTIPPEFKDDRNGYINLVIKEMIPAVAEKSLARFCDVFVEESAFSVSEARRILEAAKKAGLTPKLHADQLTCGGGAELAAEVEAASADHLEQISDKGIDAMSEAGVVGVTLPLASLYTQQPPLNCRKLIESGVQVAVATDFNPGSAPSYDLPLALMMACNQGGLTPAGALKGATIYAAKAIRRDGEVGSLQAEKSADFAIIDAPDPDFWLYHYRPNCCLKTFIQGERVN